MNVAKLKRKCGIALGTALTALQLCAPSDLLNAVQPETFFDIGGGARLDRYTDLTKAYGTPPLAFLEGARDEDKFLFKDKIKAKRLNFYVLQANAQVRLCDYWFVRGYASYGWLTSGRYREEHTNRFLVDRTNISNIRGGRARDLSAGFGYLYPGDGWWGCWGLGPALGYGCNDMLLEMGNFKTDGFENRSLKNLHYLSRWSGPWVGADFVYEPPCHDIKLTSSLEWHWATWHAERRLQHDDIKFVEYSDSRKSNKAGGLVFNIDGQWNFWRCWHMSIAYKFQFWKTRTGELEPKDGEFRQLGFPYIEVIHNKHTRWYSDTFTFNIGCNF